MKKTQPKIDIDTVFAELESDRKHKALKKDLTSSSIIYQISETHEGYLEQINENGDVLIGQFEDGVFRPIDKL